MKKLLLVFTVLVLVIAPQVHALEFQNVSVLNNSDSYLGGSPKITGNGTNNVTVTFDAAKLKIVAANPDIGRTIDAAWLGVKVVAPKDVQIDKLKKATYVNNSSSTKKSFWNNQDSAKTESQDSEHYINVFGAVTEEMLSTATKNNTMIKYSWVFDWDNDGNNDQTVTILVDPKGITLTAKNNDDVLWNQEKYNNLKPATNPNTSDNISLLITMMIISLITGICAFRKLAK